MILKVSNEKIIDMISDYSKDLNAFFRMLESDILEILEKDLSFEDMITEINKLF